MKIWRQNWKKQNVFWNVSEIWGFGSWLWAKKSERSQSWILHMETKTDIAFWPVLPCRWVPERQPESSAISLDLCKTASVTLRSIYQICISIRLNGKSTICTKNLCKRTFIIFDFIGSAYQLTRFIAEKAFTQLPKEKLDSTLTKLKH